jgi:predicted esterase
MKLIPLFFVCAVSFSAFAQTVVFTEDFDVTIGTDAIGGVGAFSYGLDEDGAGGQYKQINNGVWGAVKASDSFDDIDAQPNKDGTTSAKLLGTILDSAVLNQGAGIYTLQFDVIGADSGAAYVYVDAGWNYDTSGNNTLVLDVSNGGFSGGAWTPLTGTGSVTVSNLVAQSINTTVSVADQTVDFMCDGVSAISVAFGAYDSAVAFDNVVISSPNTNDAPEISIEAAFHKYIELSEGSTNAVLISASDAEGNIDRIEVRINDLLADENLTDSSYVATNLFQTLEPGFHTLEAIAWDNLGSSASDSREFYIVPHDGELMGQHPYYAGMGRIKEYLRFLPDDYNANTNIQWPLMVWLHGSGNRGEDATKLRGAGGPPSRIKNNDLLLDDFIVLSPQCISGGGWGGNPEQNQINSLVDEHIARFRIDTNRLIITGQSMGGYGTWTAIKRNPNKYAAAVPICGNGDKNQAASFAHLPIWIFHGDSDGTVPYQHSVDMYNALTNAGAQNTKFHTITNGPHNVWTETYQRSDLYEWMLLMTWLPEYYPAVPAWESLIHQDTDGDGKSALEEYNAGTSPTDSASVLKCFPLERNGDESTLRWSSVPGKQYTVYNSTNLQSGWVAAQLNVPADPIGTNSVIIPSAEPVEFYRIETSR